MTNVDPPNPAIAAHDAFQAYARAKRKADASLSFPDCHDAAQAWLRFLNLYLPPDQKIVSSDATGGLV
ncbi:hypothetical protein [Mesorhizobium sp. NPDC059025]|uniref:hypothetical protein n=1 Tax=unclassified Mesorhizobium TaxID=325217 RepID=UPI0036C9B038